MMNDELKAKNQLFTLPFFIHHFLSLSLIERIAALAVEVTKILRLDEIKARVRDHLKKPDDLRVADLSAALLRREAAAPVVRAEGFRESARPDLDAPVADHRQFQFVAR